MTPSPHHVPSRELQGFGGWMVGWLVQHGTPLPDGWRSWSDVMFWLQDCYLTAHPEFVVTATSGTKE